MWVRHKPSSPVADKLFIEDSDAHSELLTSRNSIHPFFHSDGAAAKHVTASSYMPRPPLNLGVTLRLNFLQSK